MSQDAINIQLRDLRHQMRLVSALEDAKAKQVPLRSGLQRDAVTPEVRELDRQVKQTMRENGIDSKKARSPEEQWRTSLDAIKTRLRNQIYDLEKQLKTGQKTPKKVGTAYDAEALALKEVRDKLKATLEGIEGKPKMSPEQRIKVATAAIEKSIAEYERRIQQVELAPQKKVNTTPETPELWQLRARRERLIAIYKGMQKDNRPAKDPMKQKIENAIKAVEKSIATYQEKIGNKDLSPITKPSTTTITPELAKLREARDGLRVVFEQMRKDARPKRSPEDIALQQYRTHLERMVTQYERKLSEGDFAIKERKEPPMDKLSLDLRHKVDKAKKAYYDARFQDQLSRRSFLEASIDTAKEIINTPRTLITSFDVSAPLRQGAFIFYGHPIRGAKALPDMFRALASEKEQFRVEQEIINRKNYAIYERSGLYLAEHGQKLSKMEEVYQSRWAESVPGVKASQRAYTTFLNKLRADSFDSMLENLTKKGKDATKEEKEAIANLVNVMTGRGKLKGGDTLSLVFFAPRYMASRFQAILGQPFIKGSARTRKLIAKEYAKTLIGIGTVLTLGYLAGAEIEKDSRSSDSGKMRFGNTRLDPLAGLAQTTTILARVATGTTKNGRGKILALKDHPLIAREKKLQYGKSDIADVIARFLRTKLSPFVGTSLDVKMGKDVVGNKVTLYDVPGKLLVPLQFKDIYEAMQEQGVAKGAALSLLSLFGMSMSTYGPGVDKPRITAWGE
jgi:hypothetical protein